jgi:hypothetical protein
MSCGRAKEDFMQKRLVTILVASMFALGSGLAAAQSHGGGGMHGGGMGGGGMGGMHGGSHGGGSWNGGGSSWHGGSGGNWNGGGWHGGSGNNWNGGGWHGGGYRGGYWNGGRWYGGTNVGFYFGLPGAWWPGYYPYWGWGGGYYNYASYPYYADAAAYADPGQVTYIQRDQVADGAYAPAPAPAARSGSPGQYSYQFSYYCIDPAGYYPQVPQCARGWLKVVPDGGARPVPIPQYPQ